MVHICRCRGLIIPGVDRNTAVFRPVTCSFIQNTVCGVHGNRTCINRGGFRLCVFGGGLPVFPFTAQVNADIRQAGGGGAVSHTGNITFRKIFTGFGQRTGDFTVIKGNTETAFAAFGGFRGAITVMSRPVFRGLRRFRISAAHRV